MCGWDIPLVVHTSAGFMRLVPITDFKPLYTGPDPYLLYKLLPRAGRIVLNAPKKAGKSYLALQLAQALATGGEFMGQTAVKSRVLYLQFDTPPDLWYERIQDLLGAGVPLSPSIYMIDGRDHPLGFNIMLPENQAKIKDMLLQVDPQVVFIDVLRKIHNRKENESDEMLAVWNTINTLFLGRCVFIMHHVGKLNPEHGRPSPGNSGRGSSFIGGEVDASWLLMDKLLSIESRFDEETDFPVKRLETGFWDFPGLAEYKERQAKLVELCAQFPDNTHAFIQAIAHSQFGTSRATFARLINGSSCVHNLARLGAAFRTRLDNGSSPSDDGHTVQG